jgi:hypothetical protein
MTAHILSTAIAGAVLLTSGIATAGSYLPPPDHETLVLVAENDGAFSPAKRDEYMRKAGSEYRAWQDRMGKVASDAKDKSADASDVAKKHLDQAWSDVKDNWNMLHAAAPATWSKARQSYEQASQRLKTAWQNARHES